MRPQRKTSCRPAALPAALALIAMVALRSGSPAEAGETHDLQFEPKLVLDGESAGDAFGSALAAGDFDGDGLEDLAVGAPGAPGSGGALDAGRVFLYYGSPSIVIDSGSAPLPGAVLIGGEAREQIGMRLAAGDIDGDGRADLVVGTMKGNGPGGSRLSSGEALVFFGRDRAEVSGAIDLSERPADITIYGAGRNDHLAGEMAMGDFDGDGRMDLAVGAFYGDGPNEDRYHAGEVSILFGGDRASFPRVIDLAEMRLPTIYGQEPEDTFGRGIAAGDIDGDRRDDLVAGAYYGDGPDNKRINAGETFVVFGDRRERFPAILDLAVDPPVVITGEQDGDVSGRSIAVADLDEDGYADVWIGAHQAPAAPSSRPFDDFGALYVLFGRARNDWRGRIDLRTDADLRFTGAKDNDFLSFPLAAGRWGRKGACIVAFARGSSGETVGRLGAGEAFVLAGDGHAAGMRSGPIGSAALFSLVGPDEGDRIAEDARLLDWNADRRLEIALGVPDGDGARNQAPRTGEVIIWSIR